MKKWGTISLMLFAFIVGFTSTYSCGGGGSSAEAGGDADTLQGYQASDFAFSTHGHSGYATTTMLSSHTHSEYAASIHGHDGADITSGTVSVGRLPVGSGASEVAAGDHTHTPGDADTLDGMDSSSFLMSADAPTRMFTGVIYKSFASGGGSPSVFIGQYTQPHYYAFDIPFACIIHGIDVKMKALDVTGQGYPLSVSFSGYSVATTNESTTEVYSSNTGNVSYDPSLLSEPNTIVVNRTGDVYWVKVFYSLP